MAAETVYRRWNCR